MEAPRNYQLEIFNIAKNENIIAVLPTGSGKTLIATMVINHRLEQLHKSNQIKIIVFLAPTRILAAQQCDYINKRLQSKNIKKVKSYTGTTVNRDGLSVDSWKESNWLQESKESAVMVMTPAVLLGVLQKSLLPLSCYDYFIFDECHHARGDSPMALVCDILKASSISHRILGLTASPVIGKKESLETIADLEAKLGCRMVFVDEFNKNNMELPSVSVVLFKDENRSAVDKSIMQRKEFSKYVEDARLSDSEQHGDLRLAEDGVHIILHAWLRMQGVIDLMTIYRMLRTVTAQPSDFDFLASLKIPDRTSENNVTDMQDVRMSAFRIEDNIGNQTFNLVRDTGARIRLMLTTAEESGVIVALYSLQASLADKDIEDLTNAHRQLVEGLSSSSAKSVIVGCTSSAIDLKNIQQIAESLSSLPFHMDDFFAAEVNTCLSMLDTFVALAAITSYSCRRSAIEILEDNINKKSIDQIMESTYVDSSEVTHIMVELLKKITTENNDHVTAAINIGSRGVIELLDKERQIECLRIFRLDQMRIALFEACRAILQSIDAEVVLQDIFDEQETVDYNNPTGRFRLQSKNDNLPSQKSSSFSNSNSRRMNGRNYNSSRSSSSNYDRSSSSSSHYGDNREPRTVSDVLSSRGIRQNVEHASRYNARDYHCRSDHHRQPTSSLSSSNPPTMTIQSSSASSFQPSSSQSSSRSKEPPFRLLSEKLMTLCRVLYDDPQRRHDIVSQKCDDENAHGAKDLSHSSGASSANQDRDVVTIVFCGLRLNAMALSEFLKQFSPETYLARRNSSNLITSSHNSDPTIIHDSAMIQEESTTVQVIRTDNHVTISGKRKISQISSQCLIGGSSITKQDRILKKFKSGFSNILIATDVAEEGVDVRACRLVVNYDMPSTVKSYIQRRGRARAKDSHMVVIVPDNQSIGGKMLENLRNFTTQEEKVQDYKQDTRSLNHKKSDDKKGNDKLPPSTSKAVIIADVSSIASEMKRSSAVDAPYIVPSTGASANITTALSILNEYCISVISEGYFSSDVIFWTTTLDEADDGEVYATAMYKCYVLLPPMCPPSIRCVSGPVCESKPKAKNLAALECVRRLHRMRELNNYLSPIITIFKSKKSGFKFSLPTIQDDEKDENDEIAADDKNDDKDIPEMTETADNVLFQLTDVNHPVNIVIKVLPEHLVVDRSISTVNNQPTEMDHDMMSYENISSPSSSLSSTPAVTTHLYFYRCRLECRQDTTLNNILSCSGCSLHYHSLNELCFAFHRPLLDEVAQSRFSLALREREGILVHLEFLEERVMSCNDIAHLQRFHQALLCWEWERIPGIGVDEWITYEEYIKVTDMMTFTPRSDIDWTESGLGCYYLLCPLPYVTSSGGSGYMNSMHGNQNIDDDIFNHDDQYSIYLRQCANEAQVLTHNLIIQESLKYKSLSCITYRGQGNWPEQPDSINPDITKNMLPDYLITRGRKRLSVGLHESTNNLIETPLQQRCNAESDDEEDHVPHHHHHHEQHHTNSSSSNADTRSYIDRNESLAMLLQVSSLLTLIPLLGRRFGLLRNQSHSHNDKYVAAVRKCGLLGKARWFFTGLCAPTIIWRIQSLLNSVECRAIVNNLIATATSTSIESVPQPDLITFHDALTPRSCDEPIHNERLECIGDSALKLIVTEEIYRIYHNQPEGFMTSAREYFINNIHLSNMAKNYGLSKYMRAVSISSGKQKLRFRPPGMTLDGWNDGACLWNAHVVTKLTIGFNEDAIISPTTSSISSASSSNLRSNRPRPALQTKLNSFRKKGNLPGTHYMVTQVKRKTLADLIEAMIGAYYVSHGLSSAEAVIKGFGAWPSILGSIDAPQPTTAVIPSMEDEATLRYYLNASYRIDNKDIVLSKNKKFIPVSAAYIPSDYPDALRRLANGSRALPQIASTEESNRQMNLQQFDEQKSLSRKKSGKLVSTFQVTTLTVSLPTTAVDDIHRIFGYRFKDTSYLDEALTHCTVPWKTSNQRLEYFGDAVLDFAVLSLLYDHQPYANEGELSIQKSDATNNAHLGKVSLRLELHKHIMVYSVKMANDFDSIEALLRIERVINHRHHNTASSDLAAAVEILNAAADSDGDDMANSDDEGVQHKLKDEDIKDKIMRKKPAAVKALADTFEAVIGAIYLDSNRSMETIQRVVKHVDLIPQLHTSIQHHNPSQHHNVTNTKGKQG